MRARISNNYRWRLGAIAAMLLLFGAWFLYDGYVGWPKAAAQYEVWEQLQDEGYQEQDLIDEYNRIATDRGWPDYRGTEGPHPGKAHTSGDITAQRAIGWGLTALGLLFLVGFVRTFTRWIEMDDTGLHTSAGQHAPFDRIRMLDKTRWPTKGIAVVNYEEQEGGNVKRIVLDDWKYHREPTKQMVAKVESLLDDEHIIGSRAEAEDGEEAGEGTEGEEGTEAQRHEGTEAEEETEGPEETNRGSS